MGVRCSWPRAKSAKTHIESDVFAGGHVRNGSPRPPPRPFDWRTRLNAPAKRAKHSNSVPLFGPACARRPRQGPLCALFVLCPGVQRRRRSFRGVSRFRPLHVFSGVVRSTWGAIPAPLQSWKGSAPYADPFQDALTFERLYCPTSCAAAAPLASPSASRRRRH